MGQNLENRSAMRSSVNSCYVPWRSEATESATWFDERSEKKVGNGQIMQLND